jgi:hypothetical protein
LLKSAKAIVRVHSKIARGNISFSIWVLRSESVEIDPREMDPNRSSPSDPVNIRTPHLNLAHHHNCEIFMQTTPTAVPSATPLPRVPLVPEDVARRNNVFFEIDTRFRRAARLLQCLWLKDRNIPTGHHVRGDTDDIVTMEFHSRLSRDAARAGLNFLYRKSMPSFVASY